MDDWVLLHAGALGDLVLAIQLALRAGCTRAAGRLTVLSRTNPGDLSGCNPAIQRRSIEGLGAHWLHSDGIDPPPLELRKVLQGRRVISFLGDVQAPLHQRLLACDCAAILSVDPRPNGGERHILDQWAAQLEKQRFLIPKCTRSNLGRLSIAPSAEVQDAGRARMLHATGRTGDVFVIHPGSGGRAKCWPRKNYEALARALIERGQPACFVVGPVELEQWPGGDRVALSENAPILALEDPNTLVGILAASRGFIGNDSGPAHLAALLGRPALSLFGPTRSRIWRPTGNNTMAIQGDPEKGEDWGITVSDVLNDLLGATPPRGQSSGSA